MRNRLILAGLAVWTLGPGAGADETPRPQTGPAVGQRNRRSAQPLFGDGQIHVEQTIEIAGIQGGGGLSRCFRRRHGNKVTGRGTLWAPGPAGTSSARYQGTDTRKDGAPQSSTGTRSFTGGTGKLKGL